MKAATKSKLYKRIFEGSREGILVTDGASGEILECNTAFARLAGWKKTELVGKPRAVVFPDEKQTHESQKPSGRRRTRPIETILFTKKGQGKPVEVTCRQVKQDGQMGVIEYVRVCDENREQLSQTNQILLNILDSIDADVYAADLQTFEILFANKHMRDGFGQKLSGKTCFEVFRKESSPCTHCKNHLLLDKKGHPAGVQLWEGYNPVTKRWYSNADRAIRWHDGSLVRLQIAMDITEREQAAS